MKEPLTDAQVERLIRWACASTMRERWTAFYRLWRLLRREDALIRSGVQEALTITFCTGTLRRFYGLAEHNDLISDPLSRPLWFRKIVREHKLQERRAAALFGGKP